MCFIFSTESHRTWFNQPGECRLSIFIQSIFLIAQFPQPVLYEKRCHVPSFSHSSNVWSSPSFGLGHLQMIVRSAFTLGWTKGTDPKLIQIQQSLVVNINLTSVLQPLFFLFLQPLLILEYAIFYGCRSLDHPVSINAMKQFYPVRSTAVFHFLSLSWNPAG